MVAVLAIGAGSASAADWKAVTLPNCDAGPCEIEMQTAWGAAHEVLIKEPGTSEQWSCGLYSWLTVSEAGELSWEFAGGFDYYGAGSCGYIYTHATDWDTPHVCYDADTEQLVAWTSNSYMAIPGADPVQGDLGFVLSGTGDAESGFTVTGATLDDEIGSSGWTVQSLQWQASAPLAITPALDVEVTENACAVTPTFG